MYEMQNINISRYTNLCIEDFYLIATSHGYCNVANECLCETGYGGSLCTEDHDVCGHEAPCLRGGTCTNIIPDGFRCSCPPGYTGTRCETEINECDPRPCQNGGTCFVSYDMVMIAMPLIRAMCIFTSLS